MIHIILRPLISGAIVSRIMPKFTDVVRFWGENTINAGTENSLEQTFISKSTTYKLLELDFRLFCPKLFFLFIF